MTLNWDSVLAFYPSYSPQGIMSMVVYPDETIVTPYSIKTLVRQSCRQFALDQKALRNAAQFVSGKRNLTPLPLSMGCTFAPLKVHVPRVSGDAAYGYFRLQAILRIESIDKASRVVLGNGTITPLALTQTAALAHAARAMLFERAFWSQRICTSGADRQELWRLMGK